MELESPKRFSQVSNRAFDAIAGLISESPSAARCLCKLISAAGGKGQAYLTAKSLAKLAGISTWSANKAIAILLKRKFITRDVQRMGASGMLINAAIAWKSANTSLWSAPFNDGSVYEIAGELVEQESFDGLPPDGFDDE